LIFHCDFALGSSPLYQAFLTLEEEIIDEQTKISGIMVSPDPSISKQDLKPKMNKKSLNDLLDLSKSSDKVINSTREFFIILERKVIDAYNDRHIEEFMSQGIFSKLKVRKSYSEFDYHDKIKILFPPSR
jgi:hypothetical protein